MRPPKRRPLTDVDLARREILRLLPLGGVAFASALAGCAHADAPGPAPRAPEAAPTGADFFFLQLSDTHWGYDGPANPEASHVLPKVVERINAAALRPELVFFTGDLIHGTEDAGARRDRMKEMRDVVGKIDAKVVRFIPGEHDAGSDHGDAYREIFGDPHWSFDHGGIHFVGLDNVSGPGVGDEQLAWLEKDVAATADATPIVVLAHRPLFDLYADWGWTTSDGPRALDVLGKHPNVTVFFGHIHQALSRTTPAPNGGITHHAARSLVFPFPAPGAAPEKKPLPWNGSARDHGIGYRSVAETKGTPAIEETPF